MKTNLTLKTDISSGLEQKITQLIRNSILSGEIRQETHLVEAVFAKKYDVSHGTIRTAFKNLLYEGLVEYRPRRGMFVLKVSNDDMRELFSLRDCLEGLAARYAARNGTDEQKQQLKNILNDLSKMAEMDERQKCLDLDLAFHCHFVAMSKHKKLQNHHAQLISPIKLMMVMTVHLYTDLKEIIPLHESIAEAILAGKEETAEKYASNHSRPEGNIYFQSHLN
jgi:DNA-binding GntR family transcriptional regulator